MKLTDIQRAMIKGLFEAALASAEPVVIAEIKSLTRKMEEEDYTDMEDGSSGSQLDQMLEPIAQEASAALGLAPEEVTSALIGMALEFYRSSKMNPEEEDYLENEDEEDYLENEDEEDYLENEDEEEAKADPDEEDGEGAVAVPPSPVRTVSQKQVDAMVRKSMRKLDRRFGKGKGKNVVKNKNVNLNLKFGGSDKPFTWSQMVGAVARKDYREVNRLAAKTHSEWAQKGVYTKAMGIRPESAGGFLVPVEQSNQVIDNLRAASLFLGDGPADSLVTEIPMKTESMTVPRVNGNTTAYWVGENSAITESEMTFDSITLVVKKLAALVPISNELLDDSDPAVDAIIRQNIVKSLQLEFDSSLLYGLGSNIQPRGLYYHPSVTKTALNAAPTYSDLTNVPKRIAQNNVVFDDGSAAWIMNPRDEYEFSKIQNPTSGDYIFTNDAFAAGVYGPSKQIKGYPFFVSGTVNRTGTPEETDVFFGKWSDLIVGMRKDMEVRASSEAGNSFANDQTLIRVIMRVDFAIAHPESFEILTDVRQVS